MDALHDEYERYGWALLRELLILRDGNPGPYSEMWSFPAFVSLLSDPPPFPDPSQSYDRRFYEVAARVQKLPNRLRSKQPEINKTAYSLAQIWRKKFPHLAELADSQSRGLKRKTGFADRDLEPYEKAGERLVQKIYVLTQGNSNFLKELVNSDIYRATVNQDERSPVWKTLGYERRYLELARRFRREAFAYLPRSTYERSIVSEYVDAVLRAWGFKRERTFQLTKTMKDIFDNSPATSFGRIIGVLENPNCLASKALNSLGLQTKKLLAALVQLPEQANDWDIAIEIASEAEQHAERRAGDSEVSSLDFLLAALEFRGELFISELFEKLGVDPAVVRDYARTAPPEP